MSCVEPLKAMSHIRVKVIEKKLESGKEKTISPKRIAEIISVKIIYFRLVPKNSIIILIIGLKDQAKVIKDVQNVILASGIPKSLKKIGATNESIT